MHQTTKQRIIESSIRLFNTEGVANVRLQQIADEVGISVGNLAYHYKNKEAIVSAVYENLFEAFSEILAHFLQNPGLNDLDEQLDLYHAFFSQNKFYLIDLFEAERSYPDIIAQWQGFVSKMLLQLRKRLDYCVQRGLLIPEPAKGIYDILSNNIWLTIVFWIPQQVLKGQPSSKNLFKEAVWMQINPYFTPKGLSEYTSVVAPLSGQF
ncbi:MAG: TetR/AcrR family transcriptional regulator [Chitinophagales bacterium]|nr:TetR/AcrR family transcriptional regulator [Chitinophagales bacterium]